ncbi:MAG: Ig-like domain-containing protein [Candidatus Aminicenantes bacterium]|nr:Ig-like domain-containing protein [Candidatus Aminicenantes bacterium]
MIKKIGMKPPAIFILILFTWFTVLPQDQAAPTGDTQVDKLKAGKESYEVGDYENSIKLLEGYIADPHTPREKRAEAYYFLAKNYYAVDPVKVKYMLLRAFETDWFLSGDEKDAYFKKMSEEARQEFIDKIPVDKYLQQAENAFEQGKYDFAGYLYRLVSQKLPTKTFDRQIKNCAEAQAKRRQGLQLYRETQYSAAYAILKELSKSSPDDEDVKAAVILVETQEIQPMVEAGNKHFNEKNYKEAIPFFEGLLIYIPGDKEIQGKLTACREMLEKEKAAAEGNTPISKEGKKLKKKFPIIPVLLGAVGVAVVAYLLFKKKSSKTGSINVTSNPDKAAIWLDNVNTGKVTNTELKGITPGSHTVKLVLAGYQDFIKTVTVERGKVAQVEATLINTPAFVTTTDNVQVPEGGRNTFEVWLSVNPSSDVTVTVSWESGDTDITVVSGSSLVFLTTNGTQRQVVTLGAAWDEDAENGTAVIKIHAEGNTGIQDKTITAVEQDLGNQGALTVTPADKFFSTGKQAGPFLPASKTYLLQNTGRGSINWTATKLSNWITLSGASGTLTTNATATVIVALNENVNLLQQGNYSDTVSFVNNTNGAGTTTRVVELQVTAPTDTPPTVSIQSPANGAVVYGTIPIQATASDDHGVSKVEIYIDGAFSTSLINSPYTYQWNTVGVSNGNHTVTAKAYDTINQTNEVQVTVAVNNSSLVVDPTDGFFSSGYVGGPFSPLLISYTLSNQGPHPIQWTLANTKNWLTLSSGGGALAAGESAIISAVINENANTLVPGTYNDVLTFVNVTNGNGNTTRGVTLQVADSLPTVSIQSPTVGAVVYGTINIQVQAADNIAVSKVEIYIDNIITATLTVAPYNYSWNTAAVTDGAHTIKAVAYDNLNQTNEALVGVTVNNSSMGATPADNFSSSGTAGGPFSPASIDYTISNTGSGSIHWTITKTSNWLTFSSASGTLAGGGSVVIAVTVNANANSLGAGTYNDTLTFTNTTNGLGNTTRSAALTIN